MSKGVRMIDGKEYLLAGRTTSREAADRERAGLLQGWERVRVIKRSEFDYMLYVHAAKNQGGSQ